MTNKEAVEILNPLFSQCKGLNGCMGYIEHYFTKNEEEAPDLAIKALEEIEEIRKAYESDYQIDDVIQVCTELWG